MEDDRTYDVVIAGSGLGGLLCGYYLAGRGMKVCVLEKNVQYGGCLQVFSRDKTLFDTGVHYIGELDEGEPLHRIFSYFGLMEHLKLERLDTDAFDVISFDGDPREYPLAQGREHFVNRLAEFFPEERVSIQRYVDVLKEVSDSFYANQLRETSWEALNTEAMRTDAQAFIASLTSNIKLREVLAGNIPLYGGLGGVTPLHQHALIVNSYLQSAWRCVDGGAQMAKHLAAGIRSRGGALFRRKEVSELQVENGVVRRVQTADGDVFEAKYVIANFAPEKALALLRGGALRASYRRRIADVPETTSFFALYVVFKPGTFPYLTRNYYHYSRPDVWSAVNYHKAQWPDSWLLYPAAVSPAQPHAVAATVLAYMHYDEVRQWEDSFNTTAQPSGRGDDYENFKHQRGLRLINAVNERFPGFKHAIQSWHTATPLTLRDYLNVPRGAAYGKLKDYRQPHRAFVSPQSKIPNLFFTGQYVHLHGIKGVTTTALLTCGMLLNEPVFAEVVGE